MLSVGDGLSMPARLERFRVVTEASLTQEDEAAECRSWGNTKRLLPDRILLSVATAARRFRPLPILLLLAAGLVIAFILHLSYGGTWLLPADVLRELKNGMTNGPQNWIVWQIRLPRALACVAVGAMLAISGASFQSLFKNPLADPYIIGVASGAAVGGVLSLIFHIGGFYGLGTMGLGFVTGLLSLLLVFALAQKRGVVDVTTLLLAGVVVGSLLAALTSLMLYMNGEDTVRVLAWLMGNMSPMFWHTVLILSIACVIGSFILLLQGRNLNAFAIGESTARHLGINTSRLKFVVLVTGSAMISVCVGAVGIIGFLGLAAPHIARRLLGVDWRVAMPGALITGPIVLLVSDILAQRVLSETPMPVGVVTALIGAPFLLVLLRRDAPA